VPIAEDCGLILPIGHWVLREACRQARWWHSAGPLRLSVAVNVSALEFRDPGFVDGVRTVLLETGLEAEYLEIELTERILMEDAKSTTSVLQELRRMGVRLAIDDFGIGYSSLSYLLQFSIDILKIDRSFVQKISANSDDRTIVSAIIGMGRNLRYKVVAEGVETQEQSAYLLTQGCSEGQGFLFYSPMSAVDFTSLLLAGTREKAVSG
jgi:EAL domain-containing protein (putative c-di-GMP-specific phosphodiesterase class I)